MSSENLLNSEPLLDVEDIKNLIPHRYPMLLLDQIHALSPGQNIVAIKNVSINEPFFTGHFPNKAIMPGVLIVEALAQAGAVCMASSAFKIDQDGTLSVEGLQEIRDLKINNYENNLGATKNKIKLVMLLNIVEAKFRKPVVPGNQLHLFVEKLQQRGKMCKLRGFAKVNGALVAEAEFMAMEGD